MLKSSFSKVLRFTDDTYYQAYLLSHLSEDIHEPRANFKGQGLNLNYRVVVSSRSMSKLFQTLVDKINISGALFKF